MVGSKGKYLVSLRNVCVQVSIAISASRDIDVMGFPANGYFCAKAVWSTCISILISTTLFSKLVLLTL